MRDEMVMKGAGQCFQHFVSPFALGDIMLVNDTVIAILKGGFIVVIITLV